MTATEIALAAVWLRHFTDKEYDDLLALAPIDSQSKTNKRRARREFMKRWPDLAAWRQAPLVDRLIHPPAEATAYAENLLSGQRFYLCALAISGRLPLDYPWLLVHPIANLIHVSGVALGLGPHWLDIPPEGSPAHRLRLGHRPPIAASRLRAHCVGQGPCPVGDHHRRRPAAPAR